MSACKNWPVGFHAAAMTLGRQELADKFGATLHKVGRWLDAMTPTDKAARRSTIQRRNSQSRLAGLQVLDPALKGYREALAKSRKEAAAKAEQARADAERMAALIAERAAANVKTDPFAGLTGFERQLAVAAANGIRANFNPGRVDPPMSLTGSHMALFS